MYPELLIVLSSMHTNLYTGLLMEETDTPYELEKTETLMRIMLEVIWDGLAVLHWL